MARLVCRLRLAEVENMDLGLAESSFLLLKLFGRLWVDLGPLERRRDRLWCYSCSRKRDRLVQEVTRLARC